MVHWIGFLEEKLFEELIEFLQYLIALFNGSIQKASCYYLAKPCFEQWVLHIFHDGLRPWDHSQFQFGPAC